MKKARKPHTVRTTLSDTELIAKYESGQIDMKKTMKTIMSYNTKDKEGKKDDKFVPVKE